MDSADSRYDILIIGAGLSGICSLHHIRQRFPDWTVKVIEAGSGVGGTWYWNRYPGARFDSESVSYQFSWDRDLLNEWHWKETFSPQPETLKYIERVCDKHNLRDGIQFNTRVKSAHWEDQERTWKFVDEAGNTYRTRFFISCVGVLSSPTLPAIPDIEKFEGRLFHTSRWPKDLDISRDFIDKRIGVIGTGATGIQTITEVSKQSIQSLTVFQRTANWSAPLRNTLISVQQMDEVRANYDHIFRQCAETPSCFLHKADPRKSSEVTQEERVALWEKLYSEPGFGKWLGTFSDTYTDRAANKLYSDFIADKIRARVSDPRVAEHLIPKDHGFGLRRIPLESGYFEVYNDPKVHLVNLRETPFVRATRRGLLTSDGTEHELDVLICATGFNAITGAFSDVEWHGKDDRPLIATSAEDPRAVWVDHKPRTFLGITAEAMPNMFMVLGPHQPFGNIPRSIEHAVDVVVELLQFCKDNDYTYVEATKHAVDEWTTHVFACSEGALANEVDSWLTGVNRNVHGKSERTVARYTGSAVEYRKKCKDCRLGGWKGLAFA
ncbi:Flavoprotein [Penicillium hispanicum]|uniref:Flavoprotein n=1 Tax=Penicillium hispanicum TaxID=1080232 RepID=UPI00253F6A0D|nr:Flavoprotein [Penicillium hispanicum]KAJ5594704.1 Flavoprotein [Penicillium hispanicum]